MKNKDFFQEQESYKDRRVTEMTKKNKGRKKLEEDIKEIDVEEEKEQNPDPVDEQDEESAVVGWEGEEEVTETPQGWISVTKEELRQYQDEGKLKGWNPKTQKALLK